MTIRQPPKDGREDDLHAGINSGQPADRYGRGMEVFCVERENRNDDAKADQVDEDRQEQDEKR